MGWRYLLFTLGGFTLLLWALRFFVFNLEESPRYLVGRGHDEAAVAVIHRIAAYNGRTSSLTVDQLTQAGEEARQKYAAENRTSSPKVLSQSSSWSIDHVKALFETKKLAWSTSLLISLWGMTNLLMSKACTHEASGIIGLASTLYNNFLPFLLASRGAQFGDSSYYITYRNVSSPKPKALRNLPNINPYFCSKLF